MLSHGVFFVVRPLFFILINNGFRYSDEEIATRVADFRKELLEKMSTSGAGNTKTYVNLRFPVIFFLYVRGILYLSLCVYQGRGQVQLLVHCVAGRLEASQIEAELG